MVQKSKAKGRSQLPESKAPSPKELYEICMASEKQLEKSISDHELERELKDYLFVHHPLFVTTSFESCGPLLAKFIRKRYPFDFSIEPPMEDEISIDEWKYDQVLNHLKQLETIELRLLFIARWLKQEGVCEPEEIIPKALLRRVLADYRKKERFSKTDIRYTALINIWRPYFKRLLEALQGALKNNRPVEALMRQGYEETAIRDARNKRSDVQAIVNWLHARKNLAPRKLENAHSRLEGIKRERRKRHNFPPLNPVK